MRSKVILLVLSVFLFFTFFFYFGFINPKPVTIFKKGTIIGSYNLSNKSWNTAYPDLLTKLSRPIYLSLTSKSQSITPEEIGISIDRDRLAKLTKTCRFPFLKLLCKNTSNEKIDPESVIIVDNEKLGAFIQSLEKEVQYLAQNTVISFEDYSFRAVSPEAGVLIDKSLFETKSGIARLITSEDIKIKLSPTPIDNVENQHEATRLLIKNMSYPLLIKYGGHPVYIPTDKIGGFIKGEVRDVYLYGVTNFDEISRYLGELQKLYENDAIKVIQKEAVMAIQRALLYRSADYKINSAIILPLEGLPKTNGELHDAYMEVIKSQQRAYRFEHGKLTKIYIVSTGITWDTPAGNYHVLGKQKMTISYFGSWYMPYYIPIGTINGYRFGFHEIPYHMDANGNIYSRDPNTMGSPATGGCIQLYRDDAVELFNWAQVDMPVYVYE